MAGDLHKHCQIVRTGDSLLALPAAELLERERQTRPLALFAPSVSGLLQLPLGDVLARSHTQLAMEGSGALDGLLNPLPARLGHRLLGVFDQVLDFFDELTCFAHDERKDTINFLEVESHIIHDAGGEAIW